MKYEKLQFLLDKKKIKSYRLAKDLGFSSALLSEWKSGRYLPKADKIQKICNYFGVPISYFYEDELNKSVNDGIKERSSLTEKEKLIQEALEKFEKLDEDERQAVIDFADLILRKKQQYQKKKRIS